MASTANSQDAASPAPSRRRGADRKREILAAAYEVFAAKGYDDASVAEIAAKVGVVEGAIYKHFSTKRELLFETMRMFYAPIVEETRQQLAGIHGARNRLRFAIWRQLCAFAEAPGVCRLIIQDIRPKSDYPSSVVYELNRESTSVVRTLIDDAVASGEWRDDVPASMIRDVIFGGIEHVMWKALRGDDSPDVERIADQLTEFLLNGVQVRPAASATSGRDTTTNATTNARLEQLEQRLDALTEDSPLRSATGGRRHKETDS